MFRVGQKVVCVDASPCWRHKVILHKGRIYTIDGFDDDTEPGRSGLLLGEIDHPIHRFAGHPIGFRPERFRPIVERKTDISFAHEILRKATKQADTDIGASA